MNKNSKKVGRKTKLTPKLQRALSDILEQGNFVSTACHAVGVGESTFYRWMDNGEQAAKGEYKEFWDAIKKAQSKGEMEAVSLIQKAAKDGTWQAAAWFLERAFPERWSRNRLEVDRKDKAGEPIQPTQQSRVHIYIPDNGRGRPGGRFDPDNSSEESAD